MSCPDVAKSQPRPTSARTCTMVDVHKKARRLVALALCAAVYARPLAPGLTRSELRSIVLRHGVGGGAYDEVIQREWQRLAKDHDGRAISSSADWGLLLSAGAYDVEPDLRPDDALACLASVLDELDDSEGKNAPKGLSLLKSHCSSISPDQVELAIGLMLRSGCLQSHAAGFVRVRDFPPYHRMVATQPRPEEDLCYRARCAMAFRAGYMMAG